MQRTPSVMHGFTTASLPAGTRFEAFRARINTMFDMEPLDRSDEQHFEGSIVSLNLGSMLVSATRSKPFLRARGRRRILGDMMDHILVRADLDGDPAMDGRARSLSIVDLDRVTDPGATPAHNVSAIVPRRLLGIGNDDLGHLHMRALTTPLSLLLADHLVSIMARSGDIAAGDAGVLASLTPSLLSACLAPERDRLEQARPDLEAAIVRRARACIANNLRDPRLSPDTVARAAGVSRATLYRLFEPSGGVARVIREMRLRQALRDLRDGGEDARSGDVGHALCFSSEAQFSRAFKAHFGFTAREARMAMREGRNLALLAPGAADPQRSVFTTWLATL